MECFFLTKNVELKWSHFFIRIADPNLWNFGVGILSKWNGLPFQFLPYTSQGKYQIGLIWYLWDLNIFFLGMYWFDGEVVNNFVTEQGCDSMCSSAPNHEIWIVQGPFTFILVRSISRGKEMRATFLQDVLKGKI